MLNLNQVIKKCLYKQALSLILSFTVLLALSIQAYCQDAPILPQEFSFLSLNSKALENNLQFTVDNNTGLTQLNLTNTGSILLITPTKKTKALDIEFKVIAEDNTEAEFFKLNDDSFFTLLSPDKTYSIIEEFKPSCNKLAEDFALTESAIICPDKVAIKLEENIMITQDTSISIQPVDSFQFFQASINLSESQNLGVNLIDITNDSNETISNSAQIMLGELITNWNLCIKSRTKRRKQDLTSQCLFDNSTIQSIISFQKDFQDKAITNNQATIIFPLEKRSFKKNRLEYIIQIIQATSSTTTTKEVNQTSDAELLLENNSFTASFNLGEVGKSKTKIQKNVFSINDPLSSEINLQKVSFVVPSNILELTLTPFDKDNFLTLTNIEFAGNLKDSTDFFNLSLNNNILLKNREIEDSTTDNNNATKTLQRAQTSSEEAITVSTFLPTNISNIDFSKTYTQIEQNIAPGIDDTGKTIDLVNDKSRLDLEFVKLLSNIDITTNPSITLDLKKSSKQLEDSNNFSPQKAISGFLIPPDSQPVLIDGYRATVTFLMSLILNKDESLNITYQELQTKDETPFANAFNFLFAPFGTYNAIIQFDGDREALFASNGVFANNNDLVTGN